MQLESDVTPAEWIAEGIRDRSDVGSVVPEGFEAYVRVFHPAYRRTAEGLIPMRWAEVAASSGATVHPLMQWNNIAGPRSHTDGPNEGSLPRDVTEHLARILATHTTRPELVWFAVWDGWAGLRIYPDDSSRYLLTRSRFARLQRLRSRYWPHRRLQPPAPRFSLPGRSYFLFKGSIGCASESFYHRSWQSANLWWPDDHSWIVATEIDFVSTYIAGSRTCIEAILASLSLEAFPVNVDDKIGWNADVINPPPPERQAEP